ncbi:TraM recognition domain-containing protein [Salmonella enterica]|nr:TraM recognition domain-containing protein [Salmonella enterica]
MNIENVINMYILHVAVLLYPWVSWVTINWVGLFFVFFFPTLAVRLGQRITGNLRYVGLSSEVLKAEREKAEKAGTVATFATLSNLDSPTKEVVIRRRMHHYGYVALRWYNRLLFLWVVALAYVSAVQIMEIHRPGLISVAEHLYDPENNFAGFWIVAALLLAYQAARLIQFFKLNDWFAREDQAVADMLASTRKKSSRRSGELTDIRHLEFGERVTFDPLTYFADAKARNAIFLGLDDEKREIFVDRAQWKEANIQILGVPGSGKSVMATNALAQCAANYGDAVVYFDPKCDKFAPYVLRANCPDFTLLDLRQGNPAQLNLFAGLNRYELLNLLVAGFNLGEAGEAADFFRVSEQKAAKFIANQFPDGANIQQLLQAAHMLPKELRDDAKGFINKLENFAELTVLQTSSGIDIERIINRGGCLYVVGSMDDENVIRLQKMLFARCTQIIIGRDDLQEYAFVNLMLDEFKYLLSRYVLNSLGTLRSKAAHSLLAHQSLGDFGQCGQDLRPDFVRTSVIDNTSIRWFYRASNHESAVWASEQTGEILVDSERRKITTDRGSVEMVGHTVQVQKERRYLFDTNMIQHMPNGFAVVTGLGMARQAFTNHIEVARAPIPLNTYPELLPVSDFEAFLPENTLPYEEWGENVTEAHTDARTNTFEELY